MIKIGTRAIISIDGKPMLATHWDGYPVSLGHDLLHCEKSIKAVIEVAKTHIVAAADPSLLDTLNAERVNQLAEKHQLSVQEIKDGKRRGNVVCADDYEITDIMTYRDLTEYEYDIRGNEICVRRLDGWWPEALRKASEFRYLPAKEIANSRAE